MANDKCDKCNHKLTKKELVSKQNSCSKFAKDSGVQTDHRTPVSEILLYTNHHRKTSTKDNLATALAVYFDLYEVKEARDVIWAEFEDDNNILDVAKGRRDSPNRSEIMAIYDDIVCALGDVEEHNIDLVCYEVNWPKIPKASPVSANQVSVAEKLVEMEVRFKLYDNALKVLQTDVIKYSDRMSSVENDSKTHGQLIQQLVAADTAKKPEWPRLGVTSGVTKVHAAEQGRPRIHSFSNRGGASHSDYSAQRGTLYRQTSDARSGSDVFDSMHDMNLRKSVGGLHVRLRANSAPGADDLQGDGGAPFKRTSQDIRQTRRNFQRNQLQYPEHRLGGGRASVIGQADINNTRLRVAPAPSRDFFIWRVHKDIGVEEMDQYIKDKGVHCRELVKTSHDDSVNGSYKLTVAFSDAEKVIDSSFWPSGIWVRKWRS